MKKTKQHPRRNFLKKTTLASAAGLFSLADSNAQPEKSKLKLPDKLTVVFQGDSITDYGRDKESSDANDFKAMSNGYALLSAAPLLGEHPETSWKFYNRGISGNKVYQLADRWDQDCLQLQPEVVSILIGVNDFWHTFKHGYKGTPQVYEDDLRALLDRTKSALPGVRFIIGQPFVLKGGSAVEESEWFPDFLPYQTRAGKIAEDYQAAWIPYQDIFDKAIKTAPLTYWSWDGVHPSFAGCYIMAKGWLEAFKSLY